MGKYLGRWITNELLDKIRLFSAYKYYCKVHTVNEQQVLIF